ncbi:MAG: winged helix DNA-binding protein [archaeon]
MAGDQKFIRDYLSIRHALREYSGTNSRRLSQRQLEYLLTVGTYTGVIFTEDQLSQTFRDSASTVSENVKKLISAGLFEKESKSGHTRRARTTLTKEGNEAYNSLLGGLVKAVEEDPIGRKEPIF